MNYHRRPPWYDPKLQPTSEQFALSRRRLIKLAGRAGLGAAGLGLSGVLAGCEQRTAAQSGAKPQIWTDKSTVPESLRDLYPAKRNPKYALDRPLSEESVAANFNNFYEFNPSSKTGLAALAGKFVIRPWQVEIVGLVKKPLKIDADELARKMGLEERLYRFRCVEAWAMAVPWTGFPLARLIKWVEPLGSAKFVRFVSFYRPEQAPAQRDRSHFKWPFYEALRMDEAMNELALVVTGIYGKPLPKQHGAPLRIIAPWKYGYKSPKSIVKIEFTEQQPRTFWNDLAPKEYSFLSNVDPKVPHPRWSQATERMIGSNERRPTQLYNGYGEFVADLYKA